MKNWLLYLALWLPLGLAAQKPIQVATFNIRFDTSNDGINQWSNRKGYVANTIQFYDFSIVGLQEALRGQIDTLQAALPQYKWVGVGRDDGKDAGEFSPIFYQSNRFWVIKWGTFWLNEHPSTPGFGWDARHNRIVTWALLKKIGSRKTFYVFNTHFDHQGVVARRESAKLLLQRVNILAGSTPYIVMGDFNATPSQEPIQILTDTSATFHLENAKKLSQQPHFGPHGTFNGFGSKENSDEPIDHIFVKSSAFNVLNHATLSGSWQGRFASDHFAVMASLLFK